MNSQHIAHLRVSSLHVQQGLFALLTLLVTLIVVQQFQRWDQAHEAPQIQHSFIKSTASVHSLRQATLEIDDRHQSLSSAVSAEEVATPQKWVF